MKDIKDVVAWLEEEVAHYEILAEGNHNYITKEQETRYIMAQELVNWILGTKFDPRYSARPVSREPSEMEQVIVPIRHDTKHFGRHS